MSKPWPAIDLPKCQFFEFIYFRCFFSNLNADRKPEMKTINELFFNIFEVNAKFESEQARTGPRPRAKGQGPRAAFVVGI